MVQIVLEAEQVVTIIVVLHSQVQSIAEWFIWIVSYLNEGNSYFFNLRDGVYLSTILALIIFSEVIASYPITLIVVDK